MVETQSIPLFASMVVCPVHPESNTAEAMIHTNNRFIVFSFEKIGCVHALYYYIVSGGKMQRKEKESDDYIQAALEYYEEKKGSASTG